MSKFRVYDDCLELLRACAPVWKAVARHDRDLARQLRRSSNSVRANVAEGMYRDDGHQRVRFETAIGSARETRHHLEAAEVLEYVTVDDIARAHDLADKVAATLYKCVHRRS